MSENQSSQGPATAHDTGAREEWRDIPGHEHYEVSNCGRVGSYRVSGSKSKLRSERKILNPGRDKNGYAFVIINGTYRRVHHLVLEAFVGPREGRIALHGKGGNADNSISNLRWGTYSENEEDKHRHGTWKPRGMSHV